MSELRLFAVGVDEVRDLFSATPTLARRLNGVARERWFATARPTKPGLLDKLGPLLHEPLRPVIPGTPSPADAAALLGGRYVTPDRLAASWLLLDAWLEELAWDSLRLPLDAQTLARFDDDLVAAGAPAEAAPGDVLGRDARLPLAPLPGMRVGYATHAEALALRAALRDVLPEVAPRSRSNAADLSRWLSDLPRYAERAPGDSRPAPGLLVVQAS